MSKEIECCHCYRYQATIGKNEVLICPDCGDIIEINKLK